VQVPLVPLRILVLAFGQPWEGSALVQGTFVRKSYENRLLASLPSGVIRELAPHLAPIDLPMGQTLHSPSQNVDKVYFLEEGICSVVVTLGTGATVEVGRIGREGFVGMAAILGGRRSPNRFFMAIAGHGYSIKAKSLLLQSESSPQLRNCLLRSVQSLFVQTAQTAACNRVHALPERLARWLLMSDDSIKADHAPVTQEFLAMMLGTRPSSISVAASILQKGGLISYRRGRMKIQNRAGLEEAACECYQVVRDEYSRIALV
jgi:CRP-like cAMP-binding protein